MLTREGKAEAFGISPPSLQQLSERYFWGALLGGKIGVDEVRFTVSAVRPDPQTAFRLREAVGYGRVRVRIVTSCRFYMLESDRRFQVAVQTSKMVGLTEYLLQSSPSEYLQATQHPFLAAAGQRTISTQLLSRWLTQDRFYALHGYPALIGRLIRYIRFPARGGNDPTYAWEEDLLKMLSEFMSNIVRETRFFKDVAAKYGLDLEVGGLEPNTQEYCDLMRGTDEDVSDGLTEALVLLWAMEKVGFNKTSSVGTNLFILFALPSVTSTPGLTHQG